MLVTPHISNHFHSRCGNVSINIRVLCKVEMMSSDELVLCKLELVSSDDHAKSSQQLNYLYIILRVELPLMNN